MMFLIKILFLPDTQNKIRQCLLTNFAIQNACRYIWRVTEYWRHEQLGMNDVLMKVLYNSELKGF